MILKHQATTQSLFYLESAAGQTNIFYKEHWFDWYICEFLIVRSIPCNIHATNSIKAHICNDEYTPTFVGNLRN